MIPGSKSATNIRLRISSHLRITSFFCLISLVFNTKFLVLDTVFEPAMYNIHNAEKSMKAHRSDWIYEQI